MESGSLAGWSMTQVFQTFPNTSFMKTGCSDLKFHVVAGGSTRLMFDEFLANPGTFHRLPNAGRDLGK